MFRTFYKKIEKVLPDFYKKGIQRKITYADINIDSKEWTGFVFLYGLGVGFTASIVTWLFTYLQGYYLLAIFLAGFLIINGLSELMLVLSVRQRTVFIEKILPDVLSMISSNMRSGMTIDKALLLSVRDDFGTFKKELLQVSKETLAGENLGESLMRISDRIKSRLVERSINLIVEGINSGGELSKLLENTAEDLRHMKSLRKEIKASIVMYTLILVLANCIGAPLLFGVSLFEVKTMSSLMETMPSQEVPTGRISFIQFQPLSVNIGFLRIIMISSLAINSIFGSLMIGVLETGSTKDGVRIIPLLLGISIAVFFIATYLVSTVFTSIKI